MAKSAIQSDALVTAQYQCERYRSPGRGKRLSISKPRGPRLRVQRLVRQLLRQERDLMNSLMPATAKENPAIAVGSRMNGNPRTLYMTGMAKVTNRIGTSNR